MKFLSLAVRNFKELYQEPLAIVFGIGMPVSIFLIFASINSRIKLVEDAAPVEAFTPEALVPGIIVFSFSFLTLFSATILARDRQNAVLTRLLMAPLTSTDFILAYLLPYLPIALLQIFATYLVGVVLGITLSIRFFSALIVLLPIALSCISLGLVIGSLFSENQVPGPANVVIFGIVIFGGVWMDLKMLGGFLKTVGYALPFAHAIDATRYLLAGNGVGAIRTELTWVLSYTILFFFLGVVTFRWRTR